MKSMSLPCTILALFSCAIFTNSLAHTSTQTQEKKQAVGYTLLLKEELPVLEKQADTKTELAQLKNYFSEFKPMIDLNKNRSEEDWQALRRHKLTRFYQVSLENKSAEEIKKITQELKQHPLVEKVEITPEIVYQDQDIGLTHISVNSDVPDYTPRQHYLESPEPRGGYAFGGINAVAAWECKGGKGYHGKYGNFFEKRKNIRIISSEVSRWPTDHINLPSEVFLETWPGKEEGTASPPFGSHDSGSAGIMFGKHLKDADGNNMGIRGIAPEAEAGYAQFEYTFDSLLDVVKPGDVLQVGIHLKWEKDPNDPDHWLADLYCGGRGTGGADTVCYFPVEFYSPTDQAIHYLIEKGVHVIIAAGNGNINLDDDFFLEDKNDPNSGLFNRQYHDTGAIYAGAMDPSTGTRAGYSNYGSRIDLFSWGYDVATTGYDPNVPNAYNLYFNGTSSTNPIAAGAVAALQSIARAHGKGDISPDPKNNSITLRQILVETGEPLPNLTDPKEPDAPVKSIGVQPNLEDAIRKLLGRDCDPAIIPTDSKSNT